MSNISLLTAVEGLKKFTYTLEDSQWRVLSGSQDFSSGARYSDREWAFVRALYFLGVVKEEGLYSVDRKFVQRLKDRYPRESRIADRLASQILGIEPLMAGDEGTVTALVGIAGTGKTLTGTCIAKNLKELFGKRVVVIGTPFLTEQFGSFTFLSTGEFLEQVAYRSFLAERIQSEQLDEQETDQLYASEGVVLRKAVLLFDESYEVFDSYRSGDKVVKLFTNFIGNRRHEMVTIITMCPSIKDMTNRVRKQIGWAGKCSFDPETGTATVRFEGRGYLPYIYSVRGTDESLHGYSYFQMYDTHAPKPVRAKFLQVGKEDL